MSELALIGDTSSPEFPGLVHQLHQQFPNLTELTFSSISEWERSEASRRQIPLTVVLQSWSDEYSPAEIDRLVGATLFTGLLCCYGAWCEGDGRTHQLWPHSTRIPLRFAHQIIQAKLQRIKAGRPLLPPTAARDEVFLYRQRHNDTKLPQRRRSALIVSPDRVYRSTFAEVMTSCGWQASSVSTDVEALRKVRSPHVIVHDLDPDTAVTAASVEECQSRFPRAQLYGLSNQPQRLSKLATNLTVLPKLDPGLAVEQIDQAALAT